MNCDAIDLDRCTVNQIILISYGTGLEKIDCVKKGILNKQWNNDCEVRNKEIGENVNGFNQMID